MKQIHARIVLLSAEEIERIHAATIEVLHDTNCHLPHKEVLNRCPRGESQLGG
jgi:trimethylamine:corrinoid methyltransferase-like protein